MGFNSPEWMTANIGGILAGGIAAGIYTTNGPEACAFIASHANATVVVCEGEKQLAKFIEARDRAREAMVSGGHGSAVLAAVVIGAHRHRHPLPVNCLCSRPHRVFWFRRRVVTRTSCRR